MKWISVEDRLPNVCDVLRVSDRVLIYYKLICKDCNHIDMYMMGIANWIDMREDEDDKPCWSLAEPLCTDYFPWEKDEMIKVTHWMPLPEAPE